MPKRVLYWFRNDLRLHDNDALVSALSVADEVIPVYIVDSDWFVQLKDLGFRKTGAYRTQFLLEAVADLRASLRAKGTDLLVRVGNPAKILTRLAEEIKAEAVYGSKEVTQEETDVESVLSKLLKPLNIDLELIWNATLYHVRDLPFWVSRLPKHFTEYRTQVEQKSHVRSLLQTPDRFAPLSMPVNDDLEPGPIPTLSDLGFTSADDRQHDGRSEMRFYGGETAALARLNQYVWETNRVRTYKETRNQMLGSDFSSKFSAWLAAGCLSPRLVYWEINRYEQEREKNDSTYWLIFELLWRDYFRFVALRFGTRLFKPSGIQYNLNRPWQREPAVFWQWATGRTGIPLIDANMRELNATGYMSNRGRQNTASFLLDVLGIDWTWGAAYFESLLIDYDPCSNWGNWNYLAGVGNDPRSQGSQPPRFFNPYEQAMRYDEAGVYVKHWLPELAQVPAGRIHQIWTLSPDEQETYGVRLGSDYPIPIINPDRWMAPEKHR